MKLLQNFVLNEIGGQTIAVPVGNSNSTLNGFIKLNETAQFIFENLQEDISYNVLVDRVIGEFGCDKETAEKNVDYILDGLRKADLLAE